MDRAAEIAVLKARIEARKKHRPPRTTFDLEARLRPLVHAQLEAAVDLAERIAARDRRDPGSRQKEIEFDDD